uniref:F-box domain-containing protein n=1 Tax=Ditylenchus dipsaci TaxID=166011 RepID=A0A915DSG9_9BILA
MSASNFLPTEVLLDVCAFVDVSQSKHLIFCSRRFSAAINHRIKLQVEKLQAVFDNHYATYLHFQTQDIEIVSESRGRFYLMMEIDNQLELQISSLKAHPQFSQRADLQQQEVDLSTRKFYHLILLRELDQVFTTYFCDIQFFVYLEDSFRNSGIFIFSFLRGNGSPSDVGSIPFSVPLLSVIDTHSQLLLAECRATLEPTSNWRHFQWILDSSALQCNVSGQEYVVSPFVGKSKIREFNAKIASSASTLCLKELRIDREPENQECPPKFSSASGFSYTPT